MGCDGHMRTQRKQEAAEAAAVAVGSHSPYASGLRRCGVATAQPGRDTAATRDPSMTDTGSSPGQQGQQRSAALRGFLRFRARCQQPRFDEEGRARRLFWDRRQDNASNSKARNSATTLGSVKSIGQRRPWRAGAGQRRSRAARGGGTWWLTVGRVLCQRAGTRGGRARRANWVELAGSLSRVCWGGRESDWGTSWGGPSFLGKLSVWQAARIASKSPYLNINAVYLG